MPKKQYIGLKDLCKKCAAVVSKRRAGYANSRNAELKKLIAIGRKAKRQKGRDLPPPVIEWSDAEMVKKK
jgi:hypothetical protein